MTQRPSFLLITTDQQRWDALGCNGNRIMKTPRLDRLAREGLRFARPYPANPIPADWHHTHWIADRTIEWLRAHAARDGGEPGDAKGADQPFFCWMSFLDPHHPFCPPQPYADMYDPDEMPPPVPADDDFASKPPHYRWSQEGRYFYRGSFDTGESGAGRHAQEIKAHYYGMISFLDEQIGRVLDELDRLGLRESTHVIFTSDHGETLMDHNVFGKPPMAYESIVRVPLLWRQPTAAAAGGAGDAERVHDGVMTHLDIVPTVLDLAAAEPLPGMEGRSFAPLLRGEVEHHRDAVVVERIALERDGGDPVVRWKMLITERWKLVHYGSAGYGELFDVMGDPEHFHNLWDDPAHAEVRRTLTERLLAEIIDTELGDAAAIWRRQPREPFGTLRDPQRCKTLEHRA